jgi:hypothetical protein
MRYLTFLDYATLDSVGKSIEAKLSEKDQEIQAIKEKMTDGKINAYNWWKARSEGLSMLLKRYIDS